MIYVAYLCIMAKVEIKTILTLDDGTVKEQNGVIELEDENVSKVIELEYVSPADGGPIMRPNNPPTW